ncbi:MAG: FtsW/RodA/SpoVE family cell cycle protein, partial [Anaerolineales bacterium]
MRDINWRHFDFWLLGAVALLTIFGITMIRSAIAGNIELADFDQRQLIFAAIGFAAVMLIAIIDYRMWKAANNLLYLGTAGLLIALSLFGEGLFGSARWFRVGPILIQPSEFAKIVIILIMADFFSRYQAKAHNVQWVIRSFLLTMGIVIWILLQPDLSTSIVIFVIWFALLWVSGLKIKQLLIAGGLSLIVIAILVPIMVINYNPTDESGIIKPYQVERILNFVFPDPEATHGANYNVQQALISIGSGGWTGQGYGSGSQVQLRFLKVRHSDFIFSAMAEEFGFIGTMIVMGLLLFVILRCLRAARMARDTYGALIAYGVATLLSFQTLVNIGMNLNLLPV